MDDNASQGKLTSARLFIFGLIAVIVVLGMVGIIWAIGRPEQAAVAQPANALANSSDDCVTCHRSATPGIVEQFGGSTMAAAKVTCRDCHEVKAGYPDSVEHEGSVVLRSPTPATCQRCHGPEVAQYYQSRHSLPAYVAYAGTKNLSAILLNMYMAIPEAQAAPEKAANALYTLEDPRVTKFACETCHSVGAPRSDGSVGTCQKCHLRHEFSLEQARKPETCGNCHIGPDHPQMEIYQESAHGIAYATMGEDWNWDAPAGTLSAADFPAPTCATCHMSGFGSTATTHDVGDRLTWFSAAQVSTRRPAWQDNMVRMQAVCFECHNKDFVNTFYTNADKGVEAINARVNQADTIIQPLKDQNLLTAAPFDEPIDFFYYENWHHYGRTAKFGMWMQGADYTQWHGAYEMLKQLANLSTLTQQKLDAAAASKTP